MATVLQSKEDAAGMIFVIGLERESVSCVVAEKSKNIDRALFRAKIQIDSKNYYTYVSMYGYYV
jgi:hypothetical protein